MNAPRVIADSHGLRLECLGDSAYAVRVEPERDIGTICWLGLLFMAFITGGYAFVAV